MEEARLENELSEIEKLLISNDLNTVIKRIEVFKSKTPEYAGLNNSYLIDFFLAQALHRKNLGHNDSLTNLEKAISLYSGVLHKRPDFADNHFLLSNAYMLKCELVDGAEREISRENAIYHAVKAKTLNPKMVLECNSNLNYLISPKVSICSIDQKSIEPYKKEFEGYPKVDIVLGNALGVNPDAVVSPANSFGFMDGGFDYMLSQYFGWDLEKVLQERIKQTDLGELLVGQAVIVETGNNKIPYMISAPTMRVPRELPECSVNAYLSTKAALLAAKRFNKNSKKINHLSFPLMCTGVGQMPKTTSARQMRYAYDEVMLGQYTFPNEIGDSQEREARLFSDELDAYFKRVER